VYSQPIIQLVIDAGGVANQFSQSESNIVFNLSGGWEFFPQSANSGTPNAGGDLLPLDFTTAIAADTDAVVWLNRVWGGFQYYDGGGGTPFCNASDGFIYGVPWLNKPTFEILRDKALGLGKTIVPPVWPGLAGVTLGTPVAIAAGVTITTPMDGVLIDITAAPVKQGYFTFDTVLSYRNIGALAFQSDDGQEEFPQTLGFTSAVYCPKTMQHAAAVVFRSSVGLTGTITPFYCQLVSITELSY
jgi:hypothetical protein